MILRRLKFVQSYCDRHGKPRHYFRKAGMKSVTLPGLIGSEEFQAAYAKALASVSAPGAKRASANSITTMISGYFGSTSFAALSEVTQQQYRKRLAWIARDYGEESITALRRPHIVKMIDNMRDTPSAAQDFLRALRLIIRYALSINVIGTDPSLGISVEMPKSDGYYTWSEDEVARFRAFYPLGGTARLALELLYGSALRVRDVVKVGRSHIKGGVLSIVTQKTGMPVVVEVMPELAAAIEATLAGKKVVALEQDRPFLLNARGRPFTAENFTKWFSQQCREAGLEGRSAHGVRKAACVRMAEADCTAPQIAAVSGHASFKQVQKYIDKANRTKLAKAAMNKVTAIKS